MQRAYLSTSVLLLVLSISRHVEHFYVQYHLIQIQFVNYDILEHKTFGFEILIEFIQ